jgi:hypothetical protein
LAPAGSIRNSYAAVNHDICQSRALAYVDVRQNYRIFDLGKHSIGLELFCLWPRPAQRIVVSAAMAIEDARWILA